MVDSIANGSSPRGRGTHSGIFHQPCVARFIPAWAGNTPRVYHASARSAVHPRVGGEHKIANDAISLRTGSSPRGRGTRVQCQRSHARVRFIPAWAGNTRRTRRRRLHRAVHPRVGGEHTRGLNGTRLQVGSSPRGRGTRLPFLICIVIDRFIPAWAGNTFGNVVAAVFATVHPRVGGEHRPSNEMAAMSRGSSPRGRGNTVVRLFDAVQDPVHPRVGGEHQRQIMASIVTVGSSPRGRGTLLGRPLVSSSSRFIPAWAGNTQHAGHRPVH